MDTAPHYKIEHWTDATAVTGYKNRTATEITVNDRAATRQAVITRIRQGGYDFVERSDWGAHKNRPDQMTDDWNYYSIAIHHAGRSHACGPAALQLQEIQEEQMVRIKANDIGYHYAIDCYGTIYEGRDIRFKGEHVHDHNTGVIGLVLLENLAEPNEGGDAVAKIKSFLNSMGYSRRPTVPNDQKLAATMLVKVLREFFPITVLGGHREYPGQAKEGKICPGSVGLFMVKELRTSLGLSAP